MEVSAGTLDLLVRAGLLVLGDLCGGEGDVAALGLVDARELVAGAGDDGLQAKVPGRRVLKLALAGGALLLGGQLVEAFLADLEWD